jgi:hypothetical protein
MENAMKSIFLLGAILLGAPSALFAQANCQSLPFGVRLCSTDPLANLGIPGPDFSFVSQRGDLTLVWAREQPNKDFSIGDDERSLLAGVNGLFSTPVTYSAATSKAPTLVVSRAYIDLRPGLPIVGALCSNLTLDQTFDYPINVTVCTIISDPNFKQANEDYQSPVLGYVQFS